MDKVVAWTPWREIAQVGVLGRLGPWSAAGSSTATTELFAAWR